MRDSMTGDVNTDFILVSPLETEKQKNRQNIKHIVWRHTLVFSGYLKTPVVLESLTLKTKYFKSK